MSVNKVILLGRLGKDPELKKVSDTFTVCKLTVATSEKYKNKAGEQVEDTEWHNIIAMNKPLKNSQITGECQGEKGRKIEICTIANNHLHVTEKPEIHEHNQILLPHVPYECYV